MLGVNGQENARGISYTLPAVGSTGAKIMAGFNDYYCYPNVSVNQLDTY